MLTEYSIDAFALVLKDGLLMLIQVERYPSCFIIWVMLCFLPPLLDVINMRPSKKAAVRHSCTGVFFKRVLNDFMHDAVLVYKLAIAGLTPLLGYYV